jgi:DNA polymerase-1
MKENFVIIDANSVIHRAFHALPPLKNKKGELVNAVYGFLLVLLKIIKEFDPKYLAACFDLGEPTFRKKAYDQYKAKRKKAPQEFYDQIPRLKEVLNTFNIPVCEKPGFEGDDIIGTLSSSSRPAAKNIIVSGDLDTLQLVDENTNVYFLSKGVKEAALYNKNLVKKRYEGLSGEELIDYKALRGDLSDNIPGVNGVGEKTALELIKNFKTIENLYKNINDESIGEKTRAKLLASKDMAFLSKDLARIKKDVPMEISLSKYQWGGYNPRQAKDVLEELGFKSLIKRIPGLENEEKSPGGNLKLW